jgi:hypothetical protein
MMLCRGERRGEGGEVLFLLHVVKGRDESGRYSVMCWT